MSLHQQIPQRAPCQNVKPVIPLLIYRDEHQNKALDWTFFGLADDLTFASERNFKKTGTVSELPG